MIEHVHEWRFGETPFNEEGGNKLRWFYCPCGAVAEDDYIVSRINATGRLREGIRKLHDLQRQLQEAWDKCDTLITERALLAQDVDYTRDQLHRVARERDKERREKQDNITASKMWETIYNQERELRLAAEDRRDVYLEELANEEE